MRAKSVATGQTFSAESGADGMYSIHDLSGGDYMVSATAGDLAGPPIKVTLADAQTTNLTLSPAPKGVEALPNAPPLSQTPSSESQCSLTFRSRLHTAANAGQLPIAGPLAKRTEMLKIHQRLGLITTIPMAATLITGPMAKAKGKNGQTIKEPTTPISTFMPRLAG